MSFIISTQAELLKTKRTASFWLSIIGAALIPTIFFLHLTIDPGDAVKKLAADPWIRMYFLGWQILAAFLLPMYIILISTLIAQKNSHPRKNISFHGSASRGFSALSVGLKIKIRENIAGTNAAPMILNQKEAVRFVFKTSAWVDTIKLISYILR